VASALLPDRRFLKKGIAGQASRPSAVRSPAADLFPALGAVHVAGTQLRCQAVTLAVEQQQGVIAGRFEVPVTAGAIFLN
jgi:hypothetical protein